MRQNNLSHHSSPASLYSASSTQIVESDREVLWLKVDCVLISVIQMYQDDTRWPPFQNNHINSALLSQSSCLNQFLYWCLLQNESERIIRMNWHLNHIWDKNNLSPHSSPSSSIYSASSPHIVESDREILWLKLDCVLISVIQMYQDDTRWPSFQNNDINSALQSLFISQSIPILILVVKWEWWYHQNALAFKSRMRQNNLSHHSSPSSSIYSAYSPHIVESDREMSWLKMDCVLISVVQMYQDDTRWPPIQNNHLNSALLSQSSCLNQFQFWCLVQNQSNVVIRIHCQLNHVWDKTIFHIIPLHLLLLYIQLPLLILLKVIERCHDWKWIVFSFPWFKCTKIILDDLLFKIIISIQPYWVSLHVSVSSSIDACCKMRVSISSEWIGI